MNSNPYDVLKSLFLDGNDGELSEYEKKAQLMCISEFVDKHLNHNKNIVVRMHELCSSDSSIDDEVKLLVDKLFDNVVGGIR